MFLLFFLFCLIIFIFFDVLQLLLMKMQGNDMHFPSEDYFSDWLGLATNIAFILKNKKSP